MPWRTPPSSHRRRHLRTPTRTSSVTIRRRRARAHEQRTPTKRVTAVDLRSPQTESVASPPRRTARPGAPRASRPPPAPSRAAARSQAAAHAHRSCRRSARARRSSRARRSCTTSADRPAKRSARRPTRAPTRPPTKSPRPMTRPPTRLRTACGLPACFHSYSPRDVNALNLFPRTDDR